ncbi:MAG: hypothetical protein AB7F40_08345 [Victivallaceae bacterium]|nr:hypothetical protein [Victivallaceae bacterium]
MPNDSGKENAGCLGASGCGFVGSGGSNGYNIHRAIQLVKSDCADVATRDFVTALYSNPYLTGGYSCNFAHSAPLDDLLNYSPDSFCLCQFENISIDKISLLFGVPSIRDKGEVAKKFWRYFGVAVEAGTTMKYGEVPLYKYHCEYSNSFDIQWESKQNNNETIRIEFNPNHSNLRELMPILSCFTSFKIELCRVSRMDIAIDYFKFINPLCWHVIGGTSITQTISCSGIPQTRYFGSSSSAVQIRVYNKVRELEKSGVHCPENMELWRCEAQVKEIFGDSWFLLDVDKVAKFNPFQRMEVYNLPSIDTTGQGAYGLFIEVCKLVNI